MTKRSPRHPLGAALTNWALASVFALFAYAHLHAFMEQPRLSLVLVVAMEALVVFFLLIRRSADHTWHSWQTWLTTCGGTFFPLLIRPLETDSDLFAGQALQLVGAAVQLAALLSLNRSFGLLPAYRGLQTNGLYRLVRHPLYAAYAVSLAGYLLNNPSLFNLVVISAGMGLQVMRLLNEEQLLRGYPDYAAFAAKTRWRLIPYLW
jgi:protein-S-isoprenylcysteine O-methyltransferase Ste14